MMTKQEFTELENGTVLRAQYVIPELYEFYVKVSDTKLICVATDLVVEDYSGMVYDVSKYSMVLNMLTVVTNKKYQNMFRVENK